jgi:protein-tyrosine phosphatase
MIKVLFVCLGNICRSPAAEGMFRDLVLREGLEHSVGWDSCGIGGWHEGELPDSRMRKAASARNIKLDSRARVIKPSDFDEFDYIITMEPRVHKHCQNMCKEGSRALVKEMADYVGTKSVSEIPDPYYGGPSGFEDVLNLLEEGCGNLLERIEHRLKQ